MLEIRYKSILFCKMNAVVCIVLAGVSIVTVKAIKRIPVNRFYHRNPDKKHYSEDLSEIDNGKDKRTLNLIEDVKNDDISDKSNNKDLKFTDFILEAAKVLKTYENYDLEQTFVVIDYVVWENMYKGCKAHELTDIRRYVSDQLGSLKDDPADKLRQHLDNIIDIIRTEDYGGVRDVVDFVNSLYVEEHERFIEALLALVHRRISAGVDLESLLKYTLTSLIFDHYCKLSDIVRHELIKMFKHFWRQFTSQLGNYKTGSDINTLVTPFIYEQRNEKRIDKKRRFNTVNEGRSRKKKDSEYSDENVSEIKMRADTESARRQPNNKHSCSEEKSYYTNVKSVESENTKDAPNKNDLITNDTTIAGGEILKQFTIDAIRGNVYRANPPGKSVSDALSSKTPLKFGHSNKTIDKLIKIGTLAKEINEIIAEGKALRQNAQSWGSLMGTQIFEVMGDYGQVPTTPETVKANEGNGSKDILISMKATYQE